MFNFVNYVGLSAYLVEQITHGKLVRKNVTRISSHSCKPKKLSLHVSTLLIPCFRSAFWPKTLAACF